MKLFYTLLFGLISFSVAGQSTPVLSKTTATWCPRCGDWGWSYMQEMKSEFQDETALVLGVHYLGSTLENETSIWFAENLGTFGQPQFFVNHERIPVTSGNWEDQVPVALEAKEEAIANTRDVLSISKVDLLNDELEIEVNVSTLSVIDPYLNVYLYEDKVEANQSGSVTDNIHPNVLRASMSDNHEGISINSDGFFTFKKELDPSWNKDEIGVLVILWKQEGDDYTMRATQGVSNIIARSSIEDQLDQDLYDIKQDGASVQVITSEAGLQSVTLTDMAGRTIVQDKFEYNIELNNPTISTGQYLLTIENAGKTFTKKLFLNN